MERALSLKRRIYLTLRLTFCSFAVVVSFLFFYSILFSAQKTMIMARKSLRFIILLFDSQYKKAERLPCLLYMPISCMVCSRVLSLTDDGGNQSSSSAPIAKFAEINALPGSHIQPSTGDRNGQATAHKSCFGMRWHIVVPFKRMHVVRFPLFHQSVEYGIHIGLYVRVGILIDA
jgi:hypothetical protein